MTRPALALTILLTIVAPGRADDAAPAPSPTGLDYAVPAAPPPADPGGLVLRLLGLTAALLALCGGVAWAARKANRAVGPKGDGNGRLRAEGTLALDRRCAVHLIRVDEQTVAVTTDATGLRSIVVLSEPFEAALAAQTNPH